MHDARFDALTLHIVTVPRRIALGGMLAMGAGLRRLVASDSADARNKKKKRKRRRKRKTTLTPLTPPAPTPFSCPAGQEVCAGLCCSPERKCVAGGCQCKTPCGLVCCLNGQVCLDENTNSCGCIAASCPVGCDCGVSAGGIRVCFESVVVVCGEIQACASNFDCPVGTACGLICGAMCLPLCDV
jgi:hypothetical protein